MWKVIRASHPVCGHHHHRHHDSLHDHHHPCYHFPSNHHGHQQDHEHFHHDHCQTELLYNNQYKTFVTGVFKIKHTLQNIRPFFDDEIRWHLTQKWKFVLKFLLFIKYVTDHLVFYICSVVLLSLSFKFYDV